MLNIREFEIEFEGLDFVPSEIGSGASAATWDWTQRGAADVAVAFARNSDILALGRVGSLDTFVVRLREEGGVAWSRGYKATRPFFTRFRNLAAANDNGLFVLGTVDGNNAMIMRLDRAGHILWTKGYEFDNYREHTAFEAVALPDGGLFVMGGSVPNDVTGWMMRVGSDGSVVWKTEVTKEAWPIGVGLVAGDLLAAWRVSGELSLTRLRLNGATVWRRTLNASGYSSLSGRSLSVEADGTSYLAFEDSDNQGVVFKVSPSGAEVWSKLYIHKPEPSGEAWRGSTYALAAGNGSDLVLCGTTLRGSDHEGYNISVWFKVLDKNGAIVAEKEILPNVGQSPRPWTGGTLYRLILRPDGVLVGGGFIDPPSQSHLWVRKTTVATLKA